MVGGGQGAFIGAVHRLAARMDGAFRLVAGALSSDPERARLSGLELGLAPERVYSCFESMAQAEARRDDGIDAVAIVTPNHMHFPVAKAFLDRGIHVICDKPMTATLAEAEALAALVKASGKLFVLTHTYTAYPMVRQAREMVRAGAVGAIRIIQAEYAQGWLATPVEADGANRQAAWRMDPARSGPGGALGDIGTHAYNLVAFVTGLEVDSIAADLSAFGAGRVLDNNVNMLMRFAGGAKGMLWASQVAVGCENGLRLRVFGDKGALDWAQEDPNHLWYAPEGGERRLISRNGAGTGADAARLCRVPCGHPEGYLEAFANLYDEAARAIRAADAGLPADPAVVYPTVDDGLAGIRFVDAAVRSSAAGGAWAKIAGH